MAGSHLVPLSGGPSALIHTARTEENVYSTGAIWEHGLQEPGGRRVGMSAVAIIWISVAAACCGLCVYGINRAVRRSKERKEGRRPALTGR